MSSKSHSVIRKNYELIVVVYSDISTIEQKSVYKGNFEERNGE